MTKKKNTNKTNKNNPVQSLVDSHVWKFICWNKKGKENLSILDYYCTDSNNADWLRDEGYDVDQYHPNKFPLDTDKTYDIALCIYVANKIENEFDLNNLLYDINERVKTDGNVFLISSRNKHKQLSDFLVDTNQYFYTYMM